MPSPRVAVWILAAVSFAMVAVTLVLSALAPSAGVAGSALGDAAFSCSSFAFAVVGGFIVARQPRSPIAWLFVAIGVLMPLDLLLARWLLFARQQGAELGDLALWAYNWLWVPPIVFLVTVVPLLFPDGAPPGRRWRPLLFASWATVGVVSANYMARPQMTEPFSDLGNPYGAHALLDVWPLIEVTVSGLWGLVTIACVAALVARFRRSRGIERQQLKWFASALTLAAGGFMLYVGLTLAVSERFAVEVLGLVMPVVVVAVPVAAAIAIFRYRLYDIDVVIERAIVYGSLSAVVAVTYVALVVVLQVALRPLTSGSEVAVAGSTLATLALIQPLRRRIQGAVDRRFYRARYDAQGTLDAFTSRLRDEVDIDAVRHSLLFVIDTTVSPRHANVWLRRRSP